MTVENPVLNIAHTKDKLVQLGRRTRLKGTDEQKRAFLLKCCNEIGIVPVYDFEMTEGCKPDDTAGLNPPYGRLP